MEICAPRTRMAGRRAIEEIGRVYVANTGANSISFFNTTGFPFVLSVSVGAAPMGIVIVSELVTPTLPPTATASRIETPTPTVGPQCVGDCDGNRQVSIDELVVELNIALGLSELSACRVLDADTSSDHCR